jgi:predicted membrane protein
MGQVDLDLTRVQLAPGASDIEVLAIMGQVNVIVPHNLHVECDGDSLMGEFRLRRETDGIPSPDAPTVRISGHTYMGSVHVKVVDPTIPNWRDKRRARRYAKQLKRLERDGLRG